MLNDDINRLEGEGATVAKKMDLRGKQFHLLLHTVQVLTYSCSVWTGWICWLSACNGAGCL